jgi:CheY-like chemotaxis protein
LRRILLIDGDVTARKPYAESLRSVGFDVIAVSNAQGAIILAVASRADVVIIGANRQDGIDSVEVERRLRNDVRTRSLCVVVLQSTSDDERRCEPSALALEIRRVVAERPAFDPSNPLTASTFEEAPHGSHDTRSYYPSSGPPDNQSGCRRHSS